MPRWMVRSRASNGDAKVEETPLNTQALYSSPRSKNPLLCFDYSRTVTSCLTGLVSVKTA